jgi:hypothetical protein
MAELDLDEIKKKKFNISVENLITIGAVVVTVVGMWYKDGKPAARFEAGLQMRITAKLEDVQALLDRLKIQ